MIRVTMSDKWQTNQNQLNIIRQARLDHTQIKPSTKINATHNKNNLKMVPIGNTDRSTIHHIDTIYNSNHTIETKLNTSLHRNPSASSFFMACFNTFHKIVFTQLQSHRTQTQTHTQALISYILV